MKTQLIEMIWHKSQSSRTFRYNHFVTLCVFFWLIPRRLNFICRHFGTLCMFHLHRQVGVHSIATCLWRWNRQSVPKRRHIKFRHRGITQKKTYDIQNTAKVWNQQHFVTTYLISSNRGRRAMCAYLKTIYHNNSLHIITTKSNFMPIVKPTIQKRQK